MNKSRIGYAVGQVLRRDKKELGYFDVEIHDGAKWVSLESDELTIAADSLSESRQGRRFQTASSPIYDGDWIVHASLSNTTEQLTLYVTGPDQSILDMYLEDIKALVSQAYYQVRISRGNSVETWNCFPAEWSIDRSHVYSHNIMAKVTLAVPRLPRVIYEARP